MTMKGKACREVEWIYDEEGNSLALIVRRSWWPRSTQFVTPPEFRQQVGFIVYKEGQAIDSHIHVPIERHLVGTSETIVVRKGKARVSFYRRDKSFITSRVIWSGDFVLLADGGHGFEFLEDTILLEVKQGPYTTAVEKERFSAEKSNDPGKHALVR
jgi:hypothetical protein